MQRNKVMNVAKVHSSLHWLFGTYSIQYRVHSLIFAGDNIGRAILGGGALFGVGSLCFYGLGLSNEAGAIDRARYTYSV